MSNTELTGVSRFVCLASQTIHRMYACVELSRPGCGNLHSHDCSSVSRSQGVKEGPLPGVPLSSVYPSWVTH